MPTPQDAEKLAQKILADPNTSKIAQTLASLIGARKENPQPELDASVQQMANYNIMQMLAYRQAQLASAA